MSKADVNSATPDAQVSCPEPNITLAELEDRLKSLSPRNSTQLNRLNNTLHSLLASLPKDEQSLISRGQKLNAALDKLIEDNHHYQENLANQTEALLVDLSSALDQGQSEVALPIWDRIQGHISNTTGRTKKKLLKLVAPHRTTLNELRDWKRFAATEKKKSLIKQLQELHESNAPPSERVKTLNTLHREWKSLGQSNDDDALWKQFKKFSSEINISCKGYFKERKQLLANNLELRRKLCDRLEEELAALEAEIDISRINKLLPEMEKEWKRHAPVEQKKIKSLQKRFYGAINRLRKLRKKEFQKNGKAKRLCIERAESLLELDEQEAMKQAKAIQKEWKQLGPANFREDQALWQQFRTVCDKIFAPHEKARTAQKAQLQEAEQQLHKILENLNKLLEQGDEELRGNQDEYKDLGRQFTETLSPTIKKRHKQFIQQFNDIKRKLDLRYRQLPDKKFLKLKHSISMANEELLSLERKMFVCKDDLEFIELRDKLQSLAPVNDSITESYAQSLQQRWQRSCDAGSLDAYRAIAKETEMDARQLCVELEIRADLESSVDDQDLRMKLQLQQLQSNFGKTVNQPKNDVFAREAELKSLCLGPLEQPARDKLQQRLQKVIQKLL